MKVGAQTNVAAPTYAAAAVATSTLPSQYRQWLPYVNEAAKKYNLDPALLLGVMSRESNGRNVRGDGGHGRGLMQIDDRSWASWINSHQGGMDPKSNIMKGAEILRDNINYFHGNIRDGLAAYNCGAGNVNKALRNGLSPDAYTTGHNYSADVLKREATFKKELGGSTPPKPPPPKPAPAKYTAPSANLTLGDHNSSVKQLQTDLVHLGYLKQADMNTGPGIFGTHTEASLKKFQEAHGIHGDGGKHYGPQTRAALAKALAPKAAPKPPPKAPPPSPQPVPPKPSAYTAPAQNLVSGDHNTAVQLLQKDLVHLGFMKQSDMNTGPGIYGPHTEAAVAALQNKWGIYGDGGAHYGPQTRAALTKALAGVAPPKTPPTQGTNAAEKAKKYLGRYESDLEASGVTQKGVPYSESCANFVTSMLIQAGDLKPSEHQIAVDSLHDLLIKKGWHVVPASQAKPGDVWLVRNRDDGGTESHTELVASNSGGKVTLIGSNNHPVRSNQQINYDSYSATIHGSMILAPPN
jgi:peptidoglycan hydrolase-like protein with peptidoglycan-binding domain